MRTRSINPPSTINADPTYTKCINRNGTIQNCENEEMLPHRQTPQSSVKFIKCVFINMIALEESGGAIFYTVSGGSLHIVECVFETCETRINKDSGTGGGAVFATSLSELIISSSLFLACACYTSGSSDGGAIEMFALGSNVVIGACLFISCHTDDDGGAVCMWDFLLWQGTCILDCSFVKCEGTHTTSSDGGALLVCNSNAAVGCSNTLFAHCHSEFRGGGATYHIYNTSNHHSSLHLFTFCFFNNNSAEFKPGNDVYFHQCMPTQPFVHCCSKTRENRISYYSNNDYHFDKDDWLPLGIS